MDRKELFYTLCKDLSGDYVEIGTCWGYFADFLLDFTNCNRLFCIDPYKKFEMTEYFDPLNTMTQEQMDDKFLNVKKRLQDKHDQKVIFLRDLSVNASLQFEDNSLSFVYIDGNHMYDAVLKDLEAWYPKIRPGGILAGDDVESMDIPHNENGCAVIHHGNDNFSLCGVHKALVDFKQNHPEFDYQIEGTQFYCVKKA